MEDLRKFRFPLNIQTFAESGDAGGNEGEGGDEPSGEEMVSKALFDKKASELSKLSKQLKAMQTDEQRSKAEQEEKDNTIKELQNFRTKSILENGLLKSSVSEKEAGEIATAIVENDYEKVTKAFGAALTSAMKAKDDEIAALRLKIDEPNGGSEGNKEVTSEEFQKMDVDGRIELKISNPELYKRLSGK